MHKFSLRVSAIGLMMALLPAGMTALAADKPSFSVPERADETLRAAEPPFNLHYDSDQWIIKPQTSKLQLLASVGNRKGKASGAFDYREEVLSDAELKERERSELEATFGSYGIDGFDARVVNGLHVLRMRAHATTPGGKDMVVRSYLWQGPNGTADYGLVVEKDDFDEYKSQVMALLNGMELRDDDASLPASDDKDDSESNFYQSSDDADAGDDST